MYCVMYYVVYVVCRACVVSMSSYRVHYSVECIVSSVQHYVLCSAACNVGSMLHYMLHAMCNMLFVAPCVSIEQCRAQYTM